MRSMRLLSTLICLGFSFASAAADGSGHQPGTTTALPAPQPSVVVSLERGVRVWRPVTDDVEPSGTGGSIEPRSYGVPIPSDSAGGYGMGGYGIGGYGLGGYGAFGGPGFGHQRQLYGSGGGYRGRAWPNHGHFPKTGKPGHPPVVMTARIAPPSNFGRMAVGRSGVRHHGSGLAVKADHHQTGGHSSALGHRARHR